MGNPTLTVGSWALGRRLREIRESQGLTSTDVARRLKLSQPTVTRAESGRHRLTRPQLAKLCRTYGIPDAEAAELERIRQAAAEPNWLQDYGSLVDGPVGDVFGLESGASVVSTFESILIPGLLQTERYARAVISAASPYIRATEVDRRVDLRMARKRRLTGNNPLTVRAVIAEAALCQLIGGPEVMREQLDALRAMEHDHILVRVLPSSVGAHPALGSAFSIFEFSAAEGLPPVVCVDTITSALIVEKSHQVAAYTLSFDVVAALAAGERESVELIDHIARSL
ncbi:transcriptional regulator [Longimycelium tulufanense]|uniref:Transcriptional regulator n=1 Tax=Longimycelium tulufanense TaxID=907463 RepID=A0A8J3FXG9_9PSEU|nr:helix-turn-helix transcriptional regulator [Longimycelium tulufanense]GGM79526.1 transcriptional regulator [Longimycelium tulufanense]